MCHHVFGIVALLTHDIHQPTGMLLKHPEGVHMCMMGLVREGNSSAKWFKKVISFNQRNHFNLYQTTRKMFK